MRTNPDVRSGIVWDLTSEGPHAWRSPMGHVVWGLICCLLAPLLFSSSARATSMAYTTCGDGRENSQTVASGPVSVSISCGWGDAQASADDLAQTLDAQASGGGTTTAEEAGTDARLLTTLTVLSGTSGLDFGAPVTLRFVVVATGSGSASAVGPTNSYGYCDGTVYYRVFDAPAPGGSLIASFTASVSADAYYSANLDLTDISYQSWAQYTNEITYDYKEYYSRDTATLPPESGLGSDNFIDVDTTVGAVLQLDAEIWQQAGGGPNVAGQSGPASGNVTLAMTPPPAQMMSVTAPAIFTPAPSCNCDGLELVIGPIDPSSGVAPSTALRLRGARPNPFDGTTVVSYELAEPGAVSVAIYDLSGRLVRRLVDRSPGEAGPGQVIWDGRDGAGRQAAAGMYLCRITADERVATQRLVLQR